MHAWIDQGLLSFARRTQLTFHDNLMALIKVSIKPNYELIQTLWYAHYFVVKDVLTQKMPFFLFLSNFCSVHQHTWLFFAFLNPVSFIAVFGVSLVKFHFALLVLVHLAFKYLAGQTGMKFFCNWRATKRKREHWRKNRAHSKSDWEIRVYFHLNHLSMLCFRSFSSSSFDRSNVDILPFFSGISSV